LHLAAALLALLVTVPPLVSWFLVERTRPSDIIYWVLVPGLMLFAFLQILLFFMLRSGMKTDQLRLLIVDLAATIFSGLILVVAFLPWFYLDGLVAAVLVLNLIILVQRRQVL